MGINVSNNILVTRRNKDVKKTLIVILASIIAFSGVCSGMVLRHQEPQYPPRQVTINLISIESLSNYIVAGNESIREIGTEFKLILIDNSQGIFKR
jgi:hypothetical protein